MGSLSWTRRSSRGTFGLHAKLSFNPPRIDYTWPLGISIFYTLAGEDSCLPGPRERDTHFHIVMKFLHDVVKEHYTFLESLPNHSRGKHLVRVLHA